MNFVQRMFSGKKNNVIAVMPNQAAPGARELLNNRFDSLERQIAGLTDTILRQNHMIDCLTRQKAAPMSVTIESVEQKHGKADGSMRMLVDSITQPKAGYTVREFLLMNGASTNKRNSTALARRAKYSARRSAIPLPKTSNVRGTPVNLYPLDVLNHVFHDPIMSSFWTKDATAKV